MARERELLREVAMPDNKEQALRERAYAIWEREGRPDGKDPDHWLRAAAGSLQPRSDKPAPPALRKD
jgi:hypothetical protein